MCKLTKFATSPASCGAPPKEAIPTQCKLERNYGDRSLSLLNAIYRDRVIVVCEHMINTRNHKHGTIQYDAYNNHLRKASKHLHRIPGTNLLLGFHLQYNTMEWQSMFSCGGFSVVVALGAFGRGERTADYGIRATRRRSQLRSRPRW